MKVSLWAEIRRLYEIEKLSQRAIAQRLHCGDKTVRKALRTAVPPLLTSTPAPPRGILKPYQPQIDSLIAKYPSLSAVRVLEEIARGSEGFRGSVYVVRRYLQKIRPDRGRVYQEVIYEPGEAMQVDWGDCGKLEIGQTTRRVSVFVAVLCYSRLCYIEFTLSQHKAEFYRATVNALNFFRGSPKKIIFDNLRAAVINGSGRHACLHPEFLALCGYFCMEPIACESRDPESKGMVEGTVRYVRGSAWQDEVRNWLRGTLISVSAPPGATTWPMSVCTPPRTSAPSTDSRKNDRICAHCRRCRSIPTRFSPCRSRLTLGSAMTATVTPHLWRWCGRMSRFESLLRNCGLSTAGKRWPCINVATTEGRQSPITTIGWRR